MFINKEKFRSFYESSSQSYLLILIFSIAFIIRLMFIISSTDIPFSDARSYDNLGLSVSIGKGYVNSDGTPNSFRPPLYPGFLAVVYKIFGHSYLAVRIIQSIIGALTCIIIFLIGKRICDNTVGMLSAIIAVFYPPFIKSAELLLTELIFTFLLALIILYLIKIQKDMKGKDCVILGLLLGIALLTRSTMSVFPFFIIPAFFYSGKSAIFKKYGIVLLFFALTILPWIVRNYIIYDRFVPISTQGGIAFYSSYRPPNGIFGMLAGSEDPVVIEATKIPSPALQSDFLARKTLNFILNNPKEVLILEFKKVLYLWAPFDWEIVGGRWFNFIYVIMLPFFALGFFLAFRRFRRFYPVLLPIIYVQIMSLVFYGSPRFRLPIEPYLFILAIIGMIEAWRYVLVKKRRGLL